MQKLSLSRKKRFSLKSEQSMRKLTKTLERSFKTKVPKSLTTRLTGSKDKFREKVERFQQEKERKKN